MSRRIFLSCLVKICKKTYTDFHSVHDPFFSDLSQGLKVVAFFYEGIMVV